jgi:hypothetical protein
MKIRHIPKPEPLGYCHACPLREGRAHEAKELAKLPQIFEEAK